MKPNVLTQSGITNLKSNVFRFIVLVYSCCFLVIVLFSFTFPKPEVFEVMTNSLMVVGAAGTVGLLIGFIFGIPRSVRYGFYNRNGSGQPQTSLDTSFADNTNLEEVSDWITKILIGITLIQFREIQSMLDFAAHKLATAYSAKDFAQYEVFAYTLLIFNFGMGFFGSYFWTRTEFGSILAQSRTTMEDIMKLANRNLSNLTENSILARGLEKIGLSVDELKAKVKQLLEAHPVKVKDDTQKDRWGGKAISNNWVLRAHVSPSIVPKLFDVTIEVANPSPENQYGKAVVVLLDSTFYEDEVYLQTENNVATVKVVAYEAFTVAALCDDGETILELDLQQVKGYPPGFYYK